MGGGSMVKVHRLAQVKRDDVILPRQTLATLDRNVAGFMAAREQLKALRFQARKGLLFYGPPGTGKTHTIHYLASQLRNHTTLLVTAEQVGWLDEYFRLARFLQPSMMIIEDIDLIARERTHMHGAGQEALLNKLLNEMDGLREDADVLFILTTNRPDQIEPALISRRGRIDQAIEFP
jgi:ATP-dependent 26S proteasome regulatory subunit